MEKYQVLLFYKYCHIIDPQVIILWQTELAKRLSLLGRIIIAEEGINGTLCGTPEMTKKYIKKITQYSLFSDINFKKSNSDFMCFDSLKIKKKNEIVILRENDTETSFSHSQSKISAEELHSILEGKNKNFLPENTILFDSRNTYESRIGKFKGAICPAINHSREFKRYFKSNQELFENKKVIMYCTGGVRCERLSAICKKYTSAKEVLHLENGIHSYCEQYPNGYFRGRNYVFDDRVSIKINEDTLTQCDICNTSCDLYNNCLNALCNKQYICCDQCYQKKNACCSLCCQEKVENKIVPIRPPLKSRQYSY